MKKLAGLSIALLLSAGAALAQVDPLTVLPDGTVNVASTLVVQGVVVIAVPIGSIIAWHKSFGSGAPALPAGWIECNGQPQLVPGSPFADGQGMVTPPNLNGDARFLRGAATSGTPQQDALQGHEHNINVGSGSTYGASPAVAGRNTTTTVNTTAVGAAITDGNNGDPVRIANETRPVNMSVVWIIRVK
jgi:hypothetical protein